MSGRAISRDHADLLHQTREPRRTRISSTNPRPIPGACNPPSGHPSQLRNLCMITTNWNNYLHLFKLLFFYVNYSFLFTVIETLACINIVTTTIISTRGAEVINIRYQNLGHHVFYTVLYPKIAVNPTRHTMLSNFYSSCIINNICKPFIRLQNLS